METVALGAVGTGVLLVWAAVTRRSPIAVLKAVLNGQPIPEGDSGPVVPPVTYVNPKADLQNPTPGPLPAGPLLSPKQSAQNAEAAAPTGKGRERNAPAGKGDQGHQLVYIGQGGHKLNVTAARAFFSAEDALGHKIVITDSYRSYATQAAAKKMKPTLAAAPGTSEHEKGNAIDVHTGFQNNAITQALLDAGFKRFNAEKEPWHFSYGVAR